MTTPQISRYAPKYHFYSPSQPLGMPFDPNGAIYWRGKHHLFYIFQNPELPHGGHCWGHASSPDLLNWTIHPPALVPNPGDPDVGIFSGCALVNKEGIPTLVYYGVNAGCCIATALDDDLIHWQKSPHNPVIPQTEGKPEDQVFNIFDPHVWVEGDHYLGIFGSLVKPFRQRDTAYLFRSDDLIHWEYLRPFYTPNCEWTEDHEDMACPDFFKQGDRHVLLGISHPIGARYYLGDYHQETFIPESHHRLNYPGGTLFAPESYLDGQGRRIAWFWMIDQQRQPPAECGNNIMSLPRVMTLAENRQEINWDIPVEYTKLRQDEQSTHQLKLEKNQPFRIPSLEGDALELDITVSHTCGKLEIRVLESTDTMEYAAIIIEPEKGRWSIDVSHIGNRAEISNRSPIWAMKPIPPDIYAEHTAQIAPFALREEEKLHLRVFIDRSIVEVFANGRHTLSQRVYPTTDSRRFISLVADNDTMVDQLQSWQMAAMEYMVERE